MKEAPFRLWLSNRRNDRGESLNSRTVDSRVANCKTTERYEGDLDEHFEQDRLHGLLARLKYSTNDQRENRLARHRVPIEGDVRNGSATLRSAVGLYKEFRESWVEGTAIPTGSSRTKPGLTSRFEQALVYATIVHAGQRRKGTEIPYVAHLLGVASIALEYGANEDEAIAALLHDAVEDAGGSDRLEDIKRRFGEVVANIVDECTDAYTIPKPPWKERKERYIKHIARASKSAQLVSAADKLHNAGSILKDYRIEGEALWSRFNGGRDGTLWYYRALVNAFKSVGDNELFRELDRVVKKIESAVEA